MTKLIDYSQGQFIENWNKAAKILSKNPAFKNLILLPTDGVCCGISFVLADYFRSGAEQDFYDIYNYICETEPHEIALYLKGNQPREKKSFSSNDLFNFIAEISVLQRKQNQPFDATTEDGLDKDWKTLSRIIVTANHARINNPLVMDVSTFGEEFGVTSSSKDDEAISSHKLTSILQKLKDKQAVNVNMYFLDKEEGHAILVYRLNHKFYLFDVNTGVKVESTDVHAAVKELLYSVNLNYTEGTKMYTLFDSLWNSGMTFKILSVTVLAPIVFFWLFYELFIARPLSDEQLKEAPLSDSIELAWSIIQSVESLALNKNPKLVVAQSHPKKIDDNDKEDNVDNHSPMG